MLAALLEGEREVIDAAGGVVLVDWLARRRLALGPLVGCRRIALVGVLVLAHATLTVSSGAYARGVHQVARRGRFFGQTGLFARRFGEGGKYLGRVVELGQFRRTLDDLRLRVPLPVASSWYRVRERKVPSGATDR